MTIAVKMRAKKVVLRLDESVEGGGGGSGVTGDIGGLSSWWLEDVLPFQGVTYMWVY